MTAREFVHDVRENLRQWSDDSKLSDEYIVYLLHNTRALLLANKYSNVVKQVPNINKQVLHQTLELVDDNPFLVDEKVLVTSDVLPTLLESYSFNKSIKVNNGNYKESYFTYVTPSRFPYCGGSRYTRDYIYYTLGFDNKFYFRSGQDKHKYLSNVRIFAIFANPEDVYPLTVDYDASVDFLDTRYPLEAELIPVVKNEVMKQITLSLQIPMDKKNDADEKEQNT